jgi:riboflavin kinase/FMN adenylyltransferase
MKWIRTQEQSLPEFSSSVLTIGNFDGVHLGHRSLIQKLVQTSQELNIPSVVCTFRPHPRAVLYPDTPTHRLFDYRDQSEVMQKLGVDFLIEEKFTKGFSEMTSDEFVELYLVRHFKPAHLIVGYDFSFGKNRTGDHHFLNEYCSKNNIRLTTHSALELDGQVISSSLIRKLLEHGDLKKTESYLGRKYYLRGPVRVGYQRGRTIGVPTANISPEIEFVPRNGVYFTKVYWKDQIFSAITNIGYNPTFHDNESNLKVETHIFNFSQDIYGDQIKVELLHFHRDEIKFANVEALKNQIQRDFLLAQDYFKDKKNEIL